MIWRWLNVWIVAAVSGYAVGAGWPRSVCAISAFALDVLTVETVSEAYLRHQRR